MSIRDHFERANPTLSNKQRAIERIDRFLRQEPELVNCWHRYLQDQRATPLPWFDAETAQVGMVNTKGEVEGVRNLGDSSAACAEYVYLLTCWVLARDEPRWVYPSSTPSWKRRSLSARVR